MADADVLTREPPHSDDAELAVLAGILLRAAALDQIGTQLRDEHFYRTAHRLVFSAMVDLHRARAPIDPITLAERLRVRGQLEEIGGLVFIDRLMDVTATSANIANYAQIVVEKAILRRLISVSHDILAQSYNPADEVDEIVDHAVASVLEVASQTAEEGVVPLDTIIRETIAHLSKVAQSGEIHSGVASGFFDLDRYTNGFQKGDLIICAARPGMGKTSFALNVAQFAASEMGGGKTVLFFSMEMPRAQLGLRLICSLAGVDMADMRTPERIEMHFPQLIEAAQALYTSRLHIDDTANLSVQDVRMKARRLKAEKGLDMVCIDYIQLMRAQKNVQSREQEIAQISRNLKILAKEMEIPVIALAQLNRMVEQRDNKRPRPADLRESGALEQDADMILFIYRDDFYNEDSPEPGIAEIIIGKHRNGPIGTAKLIFDGRHTRFQNRAQMGDGDVDEHY
ncbi:MAG: replicative DNA helicase [Deltaproteobacteria bacterium]|nr:replicative DNA helicase [Deltaproteobacteria bacterium]